MGDMIDHDHHSELEYAADKLIAASYSYSYSYNYGLI